MWPNMLKELCQRRALRRGASPEPSGLCPLSRLHTAVVLTDSPGECADVIRTFSHKYGIKCTMVNVTGVFVNVNWFGKPRGMRPLKADLFICLLPGQIYTLDYLAASSRSRFKVGRYGSPLFNLVLMDNTEKPISQVEAFREIIKILEKIV